MVIVQDILKTILRCGLIESEYPKLVISDKDMTVRDAIFSLSEVVCVDDGSKDASLAILQEYQQKDDRVKVLTQQNKYAGVARNNGLKVAQGEYVGFVDSDDWVDEAYFEKILPYVFRIYNNQID